MQELPCVLSCVGERQIGRTLSWLSRLKVPAMGQALHRPLPHRQCRFAWYPCEESRDSRHAARRPADDERSFVLREATKLNRKCLRRESR